MFDAQVPKDHNPTATFFFGTSPIDYKCLSIRPFFLFIVGLLLATYCLLVSLWESLWERRMLWMDGWMGGWMDGDVGDVVVVVAAMERHR